MQNVADLREQLGLNKPLPEQYWLFVSGLVRGQLGTSLMFRQPVNDMVLSRVPITIGLAVYAMVLAGDLHAGLRTAGGGQQGRLDRPRRSAWCSCSS